jgi:hypothetical protein
VGGEVDNEITPSDGGAFVAVKAQGRLANADSVEPSPSGFHSPSPETPQAPISPAPHLSAVPDGEPSIPSPDADEGKNVGLAGSAERVAPASIVHAQSGQAVTLSEADIPAFIKSEQRKSIADYRPHCLNPDACGASGLQHCYTCRRAMEAAESEVA